jgi:hypothetical protein
MKEEQTWSEAEIRDLILFAQSLREENEDLRSKVILMDTLVKKREAALKQADRYIKALEQRVLELQFPTINLN